MVDDDKIKSEKNRISVFKRVYTRHKRQGKNPNRIDDLLGESGYGVIDVARIRARVRSRCQMASQDSSIKSPSESKTLENDIVFGKNLVTSTESTLPVMDYKKSSDKTCICFSFREFPGVLLYPNALDKELQLHLAYQAVTEYCELGSTTTRSTNNGGENSYGSHRTNIDLLSPKAHEQVNSIDYENEKMWNLWKRDVALGDEDPARGPPPEKKRKNNVQATNYYRRFSKLSWATMGYHYDWTERSYHPQKKSKMPDLVATLSTVFATAKPSNSNCIRNNFTPSASIVNYYTTKSTMGGHRDDLEADDAMDKPIVSISLGLPGIFVLGGPVKDEYDDDNSNNLAANRNESSIPHPVRALLLRPGDVLVMGGASRLNYHAMARVMPQQAALEYDRRIGYDTLDTDNGTDNPSFANLSSKDLSLSDENSSSTWKNLPSEERDYLAEYLVKHRVNINVRQVYPDEG